MAGHDTSNYDKLETVDDEYGDTELKEHELFVSADKIKSTVSEYNEDEVISCIATFIYSHFIKIYFIYFRQDLFDQFSLDYWQRSCDHFSFLKPHENANYNYTQRIVGFYIGGSIIRTIICIAIVIYLAAIAKVDAGVFESKILGVGWRRLQEIKELFVNVSMMDNHENDNDNNGNIENYDSINIIRKETEEMDDEKALRYHKNIVECDTYLCVDFDCTVDFATWIWFRFLFELLTSDYAVAFDIVNIWIVLLTFILWFAACYCLWTSLHDIHSLCELVAYRAWQRKYLQETNMKKNKSVGAASVNINNDASGSKKYWFESYFETIKYNEFVW